MKASWSKSWKGSVQPRKQRKYVYNAPLHLVRKLMVSLLSKDLRTKHNKRNIMIRKGDTVKILRGQFKGKTGKVDKVLASYKKVYVEGISYSRRDGTKSYYPLDASSLMITSLVLDDKKRQKVLERKGK